MQDEEGSVETNQKNSITKNISFKLKLFDEVKHDSCYFADWITIVEAEWHQEEGHHRNLNADEGASACSRLSCPTLCLVFLGYFYLIPS